MWSRPCGALVSPCPPGCLRGRRRSRGVCAPVRAGPGPASAWRRWSWTTSTCLTDARLLDGLDYLLQERAQAATTSGGRLADRSACCPAPVPARRGAHRDPGPGPRLQPPPKPACSWPSTALNCRRAARTADPPGRRLGSGLRIAAISMAVHLTPVSSSRNWSRRTAPSPATWWRRCSTPSHPYQDFLLRTSILDRISGSLPASRRPGPGRGHAPRPGARERARPAGRQRLVPLPLTVRGGPPAQAAARRPRRDAGATPAAAARWLRQNGYLGEAVRQAAAAEDRPRPPGWSSRTWPSAPSSAR